MRSNAAARSASSTHCRRGFAPQATLKMAPIASWQPRPGRNPYDLDSNRASHSGSNAFTTRACNTLSRITGTVASYCDPFHVVCGLGLHFGGKLVAVGDSLFTAGLQVGCEVDPSASALAAAGGQVAALGPVVDGIGFDAEPACYFCDGQFAVLAVDVVAVAVHVCAGRQSVAAGGFSVGVEGDAPAAGGAAAGGQGAGGQPGVHGGHADPEPFGDSTRSELA